MKKLAKIFYKIILAVCMVALAIFYTLRSVILTPFRLLEYRKSAFARETGADRLEAELMPMFLLYDDTENRVEVLKTFCR